MNRNIFRNLDGSIRERLDNVNGVVFIESPFDLICQKKLLILMNLDLHVLNFKKLG